MRKIILNEAYMISLSHRDVIFNKLNELGQDPHFMKFYVIANHEFTMAGADLRGEQDKQSGTDTLKKVDFPHLVQPPYWSIFRQTWSC